MNSTHVSNNLSVIEEYIAREATDVEKAIELHTDDIVWESPSRNLILQGKKQWPTITTVCSSIKDIKNPVRRALRHWQPPVAYPSAPSGASREKENYDSGTTRSVYDTSGSARRHSCTL